MKLQYILPLLGLWVLGSFIIVDTNPRVNPDFNSVWKTGYVDGWCYNVEGHCIEPIPPIPPLPRIKDTTYTIIYNRGFLTGLKANR